MRDQEHSAGHVAELLFLDDSGTLEVVGGPLTRFCFAAKQ